MTAKRKILFLTGTRADFGKLKVLMRYVEMHEDYELHVLVTGMHMMKLYGRTYLEVSAEKYTNVYYISNQHAGEPMCSALGNTIQVLSRLVEEIEPDLIVVHGDRLEALAGATVGALRNRLVCHIEGGEVSGTIDELIRHSVSKLSHIHMVANEEARTRLIQMGEDQKSIYIIGSPDMDVMISDNLPTLADARNRYAIDFETYAISLFHPVTTEEKQMFAHARSYFEALAQTGDNFIVIYPNNDAGSSAILDALEEHSHNPRFKVFPSLRFEHFLMLLKNAQYIAGNSSAGIREAPFYGVPTIDIGTRQSGRHRGNSIFHSGYSESEILDAIQKARSSRGNGPSRWFGDGDSRLRFAEALNSDVFWNTPVQKTFVDISA